MQYGESREPLRREPLRRDAPLTLARLVSSRPVRARSPSPLPTFTRHLVSISVLPFSEVAPPGDGRPNLRKTLKPIGRHRPPRARPYAYATPPPASSDAAKSRRQIVSPDHILLSPLPTDCAQRPRATTLDSQNASTTAKARGQKRARPRHRARDLYAGHQSQI